jgi:hypothetical protein
VSVGTRVCRHFDCRDRNALLFPKNAMSYSETLKVMVRSAVAQAKFTDQSAMIAIQRRRVILSNVKPQGDPHKRHGLSEQNICICMTEEAGEERQVFSSSRRLVAELRKLGVGGGGGRDRGLTCLDAGELKPAGSTEITDRALQEPTLRSWKALALIFRFSSRRSTTSL